MAETSWSRGISKKRIDLIGGRPERPYDEIGRIEARGSPGEHRSFEGIAIRYRTQQGW